MNARKAVLADNPELILRVLQLRFDESLSYPRISAQTGISKTAIFSGEAISPGIHGLASFRRIFLRATGPSSVPGAIPFSPDSNSDCENREKPPEPIFTGV